MGNKTAVVLMNLGGPDTLEAVQPFLFNLFIDPAIIRLPFPFRLLLAKWISKKRKKEATHIYSLLGGGSPILAETINQATALELVLSTDKDQEYKVFIAMRYWHPLVEEAYQQVQAYNPDNVVLLPLYPQFSTTTTLSSFKAWDEQVKKFAPVFSTQKICCYPTHPLFIQSHSRLLFEVYRQAKQKGEIKLLFSAHGLPKSIVDKGDPYQQHVEATCQAIISQLAINPLDWTICYQSKVGRLEWLGPATDSEIEKAAAQGKVIIVVPIAFVSEHSETLVELDIEYKELALSKGAVDYFRVPALGIEENYIKMMANLVQTTSNKTERKGFQCCQQFSPCPYRTA
jgi:ferrochelatase